MNRKATETFAAGDYVRLRLSPAEAICKVRKVGDGWVELSYVGSARRWRIEASLVRHAYPGRRGGAR